jgi:hypothetical protein
MASWHWIEPSPTRRPGHSIEIERSRPSQLDRSILDTRLKATWGATTNIDFVSPWDGGMEIYSWVHIMSSLARNFRIWVG